MLILTKECITCFRTNLAKKTVTNYGKQKHHLFKLNLIQFVYDVSSGEENRKADKHREAVLAQKKTTRSGLPRIKTVTC